MESISLQCPVTIKVKVTEKFRAKMLDKMEKQLAEVDLKLSKIDIQKKKFLEEHAEDNIQQVGAIVQKMEVDKAKGLKLKAKIEQDIADMKHLGLGAEIIQGTMQHVFNVKVGDKMPDVMNTEIIVEDEKIIEIRNYKKIIIGKIGAAHGVRGDMKVYPLTDFPDRFNTIKKAYVDDKEINIISTRYQGNFVVMKVEGVNSREEVARFTNKLLKINRSDVPPLEDGEYYAFDIIGLQVINQDDVVLGEITEILKTGSNDVYITKAKDGRQILIPALKKVVTEINVEDGFMKVIWDENQEV